MNIYPAEIESVLIGHPKVADVAVFGIPNEDWGEEVKAVVQALPMKTPPGRGVGSPTLLAVSRRTNSPNTSFPSSIDLIEEMPRDSNGKLYKRKLRNPYWEGREKAI